jgi:hypothetical protein
VLSNITIRNNLLEEIGSAWGAALPLFVVLLPASNIVVENNTATDSVFSKWLVLIAGQRSSGFVFRSNIAAYGTYGIQGDGRQPGLDTLQAFFTDAVVTNNVLFGGLVDFSTYPASNYFPMLSMQIGWLNPAEGNYALSPSSLFFRAGNGGSSPGVNYPALTAATATVIAGR